MKFLSLLFVLGLSTQVHAASFDDGCGSDQYRCNGQCISLETKCSGVNGFNILRLDRRGFGPNGDGGPAGSFCNPACGPNEYCAPFFAGHYACFPN